MTDTYYTTAAQDAAVIRGQLKALGWTSRQVSVRSSEYSMGSEVRVVIKDPSVPIDVVRGIAKQAEYIRRDAHGDILGGGNRFVYVRYSR